MVRSDIYKQQNRGKRVKERKNPMNWKVLIYLRLKSCLKHGFLPTIFLWGRERTQFLTLAKSIISINIFFSNNGNKG